MICHDKKCIFVHIPKTGGTSIEYGFNKVKLKPGTNEPRNHPKTKHLTIEKIKDMFPEEFESYFKFTVVRNPWQREYSLWKFLQKTNEKSSKKRNFLNFNVFKGKESSIICDDFLTYLRNLKKDKDHYIKNRTYSFRWKKLFADQVDYILIDGSIELDEIIRFENIDFGYREICKHLDKFNEELPKVYYSGEDNHDEHLSGEAINLIYEIRKRDIDFLKYSI